MGTGDLLGGSTGISALSIDERRNHHNNHNHYNNHNNQLPMSVEDKKNDQSSDGDQQDPKELNSSSGSENGRGTRSGRSKSLQKIAESLPSIANQQSSAPTFSPASQRRSYVEEPESETSSTSVRRSGNGALVRHVNSGLQMTEYTKDALRRASEDAIKNGSISKSKHSHKLYAFRFVEAGLRRALWHFGRVVSARKLLFTLLPVAFVLVSLIGPVVHWNRMDFLVPFPTFTLRGSSTFPASGHSNLRISQRRMPVFNGSNQAYNVFRRDSAADFGLLFRAKSHSQSMLNEQIFERIALLNAQMRAIDIGYEKMNLTWPELCRESCSDDDDLIQQLNRFNVKSTPTYPDVIVTQNGTTSLSRLFLGLLLGGVETDADGVVVRAQAITLNYKLKDNFREEILDEWRSKFSKTVAEEQGKQPLNKIEIHRWSYRNFLSAVIDGLKSTHIKLIYSAILLIITCIGATFGVNGYRSKPILGLVIGIILIVSCLAGYFVQLTGVGYINAAIFPVFFILIGIGVLILFSLENTWSKYSNVACDPVEKLSLILSWDAPCTVITSLTIIVAFGCLHAVVGSTTKNPYLQYMSFVLASGIAVLLLFALLFFTVFLYVTGRRETEGVKWYQCFRSGDTHFAPRTINEYNQMSIAILHEKLTDARSRISGTIGSVMSNSYLRYPVAFIFAIYLVLSFWACKDLRIDMKEEYFLAKNTEPSRFIENYRSLFGRYEQFLELIFDEPIDYLDLRRKEDILSILDWPIQNQFATRSVSWLKDFLRFESTTIYDINADTFVPIVGVVFLSSESFQKYKNDLILDKFQTRIVASRMFIELSAKGVQDRLVLISGLLSKARSLGISLIIKAPFAFSIQHDLQVMSTMIVAFGLLLSCISSMSLLLFGIPSLTALLFLSNLSVIIGVIGFATYWNVPINIITLSVALAGNGLATAIIAYSSYNFVTAGKQHKTSKERVCYSYQSCLLPVTLACIIPIIAYIPLLFTEIPIIIHIFKIIALNSFIIYMHLFLFLPNMMVFLTEQVPAFCITLQDACNDCCCYCFDDPDTGSIYYVATEDPSNPQHLNGFTRQYSYALTAGGGTSTTGMLLPAPGAYLSMATPVIVPDVLHYRRTHPVATIEGYRSYKCKRHQELVTSESTSLPPSPRLPRSVRQTPRRERRRAMEQQSPNDESIYEEPPSPVFNRPEYHSPPVRRAEGRKVEREHSQSSKNQPPQFKEDRLERDGAHIEMRPNWRQYLIDGKLRQPDSETLSTAPPPPPPLPSQQQPATFSYPAPNFRSQIAYSNSRDKRF